MLRSRIPAATVTPNEVQSLRGCAVTGGLRGGHGLQAPCRSFPTCSSPPCCVAKASHRSCRRCALQPSAHLGACGATLQARRAHAFTQAAPLAGGASMQCNAGVQEPRSMVQRVRPGRLQYRAPPPLNHHTGTKECNQPHISCGQVRLGWQVHSHSAGHQLRASRAATRRACGVCATRFTPPGHPAAAAPRSPGSTCTRGPACAA